MKKAFSLILVLGLVMFLFSPVLASDEQSLKTYTIVDTGTSGSTSTLIALTTIIPGKCRILGYEIGPTVSAAGVIGMSIHDAATVGTASTTNQFGELVGANTASYNVWYPRPRAVSLGIVVKQGYGSTVTIYYEQDIP